MAEESVRKTAAKRVPKKAVGRTAAATRAQRAKKPPAVTADTTIDTAPSVVGQRKAPAVIESTRSRQRSYLPIIGLAVFGILLVTGVIIGFSGNGLINVEAVIAERKANASPEERAVIEQAEQSVNLKHVPDGGLIPSENQDLPVPTAPVATTTASSTLASATSTATTTEGIVPTEDILVPSDTQE